MCFRMPSGNGTGSMLLLKVLLGYIKLQFLQLFTKLKIEKAI